MGRASGDLTKAYESIVKKKDKFGTFHKVVFHMHSPASYDYRVCNIDGKEGYADYSDQEALKLCEKHHVFPENSFSLSFFETSEEFKMYSGAKEALVYLLMAQKILDAHIEMLVLTDHNTIAGFEKLKQAIKQLKAVKQGIYPTVILGVEISCADKNHVVGMFDDTMENKRKLQQWLGEYIMSEADGTYLTSYDVMNYIHSMGGISYIAHIDTSNTFSEKYLSGAYKTKLFETASFQMVGISNIQKKDVIRTYLKKYTTKEIGFIWDEDSHTVQGIGTKCMWIKGSKMNFQTIRNAIRDYGISVEYEKPQHVHSYIRGIYIKGNGENFLSDKDGQEFCLTFSDSLNCIIGGRGTGKSTIIRLVDFVIRQHCPEENILEFICRHQDIWLLYMYGEEEYMIHFLAPIKRYKDEQILRYFTDNRKGYTYHYFFHKYDIEDYTLRHYIEIEKLERRNGEIFTQKITKKRQCLERFFHAGYSVDELVRTAGSEELNQFIYGMLFQNQILKGACNAVNVRSKSGLRKALHQTQSLLEQRKEKVGSVVNDFNNQQKDLFRIVYTQNQPVEEFPYAMIFRRKYGKSKYYCHYNILISSIVDYLHRMQEKMGMLEFLQALFDENYREINEIVPIEEFKESLTENMVVGGISEVEDQVLLSAIRNDLLEDNNIPDIIEYLQKYVTEIENFDLEFNLNSKEDSRTLPPLFRSVSNLSMGQKVVAMLSFVLGYSEYAGDCTPFIIDQPEDNLDNQYIYKNLVSQLKKLKQTRQVIIATHNATIVTNAKAEQVIVMASDDSKGWVEATGYPNEKKIKKHIINQLEGGVESFKHKCFVYEEVLK